MEQMCYAIIGLLCITAGLVSCTVCHDPHLTVGARGDTGFQTRFFNRVLEFGFGLFRFIAWATRGSAVSEFISVGIYGPHGARVKGLVVATIACSCLVASGAMAQEQEDAVNFSDGAEGYFSYQPNDVDGELFVIYTQPKGNPGGRVGTVFGYLTPETKIVFANRPGFTRSNLDLLHEKRVLAYGDFSKTGQGEGSHTTCTKLVLYVLDGQASYYHSIYLLVPDDTLANTRQ